MATEQQLSDEDLRRLLKACSTGRINVHRCDEDSGAIDYQLQREGGTVLGYASDRDGSPRAKGDAELWSRSRAIGEELLALRERLRVLSAAAREYDQAVGAAWATEETLDLFDDVPADGTDERVEFDQAVTAGREARSAYLASRKALRALLPEVPRG